MSQINLYSLICRYVSKVVAYLSNNFKQNITYFLQITNTKIQVKKH